MPTVTPQILFFALAGGILPALLWLWFWLQEDNLHPEPRGMIVKTFLLGMLMVPIILPVERFLQSNVTEIVPLRIATILQHFLEQFAGYPIEIYAIIIVVFWAVAEELFKFFAAYFAGLRTQENNEPIDPIIYLLTAALGFSAMENVLFLLSSLSTSTAVQSLITGNLRFIGATLLHVLTSGIIGVFLGFAFHRGWFVKKIYSIIGLVLAIAVHTAFNLFITNNSQGAMSFELFNKVYTVSNLFVIFAGVWVAILILIVGIQKIKHLKTWDLNG